MLALVRTCLTFHFPFLSLGLTGVVFSTLPSLKGSRSWAPSRSASTAARTRLSPSRAALRTGASSPSPTTTRPTSSPRPRTCSTCTSASRELRWTSTSRPRSRSRATTEKAIAGSDGDVKREKLREREEEKERRQQGGSTECASLNHLELSSSNAPAVTFRGASERTSDGSDQRGHTRTYTDTHTHTTAQSRTRTTVVAGRVLLLWVTCCFWFLSFFCLCCGLRGKPIWQ